LTPTLPLVLVATLLALAGFAAPVQATPPGCNPGPLPGTCCPPNADCACLLCNLGCTGLVPCGLAASPAAGACSTFALGLPQATFASGFVGAGCAFPAGGTVFLCTPTDAMHEPGWRCAPLATVP
jgi:hypothetical protein